MKRDSADGQYFLTGDELVDALNEVEPRLRRRGVPDPVRHPAHYTSAVPGIEAIEVTRHFNFCIGNAIKYLWRADYKGDPITDLRKAQEYIQIEIDRRLGGLGGNSGVGNE